MQKVIVIDTTSGIGKALLLANNGYKVGFTGRIENSLAALVNEKPGSFYYLPFDVTAKNLEENLKSFTNLLGCLDFYSC